MYNNIGGKIKGLAKGFFFIEALASIIGGIALILESHRDDEIFIGVIIIIAGPIIAWISSWFLYAFGELVEKTCEIARNTSGSRRKSEVQANEKSAKPHKKEYTHVDKTPDKHINNEVIDDEYINVVCPKCEEKLSFLKDETNAICPWCETKITL